MPPAWKPSVNEMSNGRRLVVFADAADANSNVFLLYTPLQADYTSLGSFGNIDSVATTVLPSCGGAQGSCSIEKDGIESKLVSSKTVKGCYVYDYTVKQSGQPTRHLLSLLAIKLEEGRGKSLVTLTAQCVESQHAALSKQFSAIVESWKPA